MSLVNIKDEALFPALESCPHQGTLASGGLYIMKNGQPWIPSNHICLMAEVTGCYRGHLFLRTSDFETWTDPSNPNNEDGSYNLVVDLHFLKEDPSNRSFDFDIMEEGNTVVILYPRTSVHAKFSVDYPDKFFILLTEDSEVAAIRLPLEHTIRLASRLYAESLLPPVHRQRCHYCGKEDGLMKCGRCGWYSYCSKECQAKDWKGSHKPECKPIKFLVGLLSRDWYNFSGGFWGFTLEEAVLPHISHPNTNPAKATLTATTSAAHSSPTTLWGLLAGNA